MDISAAVKDFKESDRDKIVTVRDILLSSLYTATNDVVGGIFSIFYF